MSLPNTNELVTWDIDRVSQWLRKVGLSDCIETFQNRDIDGRTLLKFNEGKCMSLTGISMKMKRELWHHIDIYIKENPPLGSRPPSKILPKGVQKFFGGTTATRQQAVAPPIDYPPAGDDSDGDSWPEDEFDDSDPEDHHPHTNHHTPSYETPSGPVIDQDDFYEDPHPGDDNSGDEYETPNQTGPSHHFTPASLSPVKQPMRPPRIPDPEPDVGDDFYETTDFDDPPSTNNKASTLPLNLPKPPPARSSATLPTPPPPIGKKDGPKRTTPPDSRKNSLGGNTLGSGSPQFPRSPKLCNLPVPPPRPPAKRPPVIRDSVSSISSNSSDSGSGVISAPPPPPRPNKSPLPPRPATIGQGKQSVPEPDITIEQEEEKNRGPLPKPPPSTSQDLDGLYVYEWYHGSVKRDYADRKLPLLPEDGTFLVRKSTRGPSQPYSLDIWFENAIKRLPIRFRDDGKYALGKPKEGEQAFTGVADLIAYHKQFPIFLVGSAGAEVLLDKTPPK